MHVYAAHGLTIHATFLLPELPPAEGAADVVVREGVLHELPSEALETERYVRVEAGTAWLAWRGVAAFRVRAGREVVVHLLGEPEARWLRQFLLGPVLGVLLHQRRLLVLHASAVEADGGVLAFAGFKGQGKSTTAAGLHARGYGLLADDIVAVDMTDPARPQVAPGALQLKLWPDAAEALGVPPDGLTRLHDAWEKRARRVAEASLPSQRPLAGLYVLASGDRHVILPLSLTEAFAEIVQHVYPARFIGPSGVPPWHFQQCAALAQAVPVCRFQRARSLGRLPEALDLLETHHREGLPDGVPA